VIVGAGVVGAACAYFAARAGIRVAILDRGAVPGGTTGAGDGNLLLSDKRPGPELDLTLHSLSLWRDVASALDADAIELEPKGGLAVAATTAGRDVLRARAAEQRIVGVDVVDLGPADLRAHEPHLADGLAGGAFYPQEMQVQPMLATAHLLRAAVRHGATFHPATALTGVERAANGRVVAARTTSGRIGTPAVVNAAGTWAGGVAALAGVDLPIRPCRGFVLVTEPLTVILRHKVYTTEDIADASCGASDAEAGVVIEGTRTGTVLIGSNRERVGPDDAFALALRRLAARAIGLLPFLAGAHAIQACRGLRPSSPDHLPVIGADPRAPGLLHACGHSGAGIGLAPATAALVTAVLTGTKAAVDTTPFRPDRFDEARVGRHG
jgi:D-hydroxyproline dehydrogenase subunit beta